MSRTYSLARVLARATNGAPRRIYFTAWQAGGLGPVKSRAAQTRARGYPALYRAPSNGRMTCSIGSSRLRQITARSLRRIVCGVKLTGRAADIQTGRDPRGRTDRYPNPIQRGGYWPPVAVSP